MAKLFAGALDCPQCGEKLRRWPTLDGEGFVASCPSCDYEIVKKPDLPDQEVPPDEEAARDRFRRLLSSGAKLPPEGEWPSDLLEDLPEETKQLLFDTDESPSVPSSSQGDGTFRSDTERRLKEHGYYLYDDGRGARLGGPGPKPGTGDLSPLDVVSLAANLGGEVPAADSQRNCPHCKATIAVAASRCPWCDGELPPAQADSESPSSA